MSKFTFYVNIGDWSNDGHNKIERYLFETNYPVKELQEAYRSSCDKLELQLHDEVCNTYEEDVIGVVTFKKLVDNGCPLEYLQAVGERSPDSEGFANMIMWFVGLSLPSDFTYKIIEDKHLNFNGFWGDLNETFGYGLF